MKVTIQIAKEVAKEKLKGDTTFALKRAPNWHMQVWCFFKKVVPGMLHNINVMHLGLGRKFASGGAFVEHLGGCHRGGFGKETSDEIVRCLQVMHEVRLCCK